MHAYVGTYVRTYVHTNMHAQIHTHRRVYIYIYLYNIYSIWKRMFCVQYFILLHIYVSLWQFEGLCLPEWLVWTKRCSPAEGATKPSVHVERAMSGQLRCCY